MKQKTPNTVVIFDFDGVILDSLHAAHGTWLEAGATITLDDYKKRFEGNIHKATKPVATLDFFSMYSAKVSQLSIFPGIAEVIRELSLRYPLTINSSTRTDLIKETLDAHQLSPYFDSVLGADVATSKVEKIRTILDQYQVSPHQAVMITDTLGDLHEANEAGIKTIAVTWGFHSLETLQQGHPTDISHHPAELPQKVDTVLTTH